MKQAACGRVGRHPSRLAGRRAQRRSHLGTGMSKAVLAAPDSCTVLHACTGRCVEEVHDCQSEFSALPTARRTQSKVHDALSQARRLKGTRHGQCTPSAPLTCKAVLTARLGSSGSSTKPPRSCRLTTPAHARPAGKRPLEQLGLLAAHQGAGHGQGPSRRDVSPFAAEPSSNCFASVWLAPAPVQPSVARGSTGGHVSGVR